MGKTTLSKAKCSAGSVQGMFVDGVCFMEFGENAMFQKVREEICRCARKFGGKELAEEMKRAPIFRDVVNQAAEWLEGRAALLVCDDLWATDDNELGYVPELKNFLRDAPKSVLLISTRDWMIARAVSSSPMSFEFVEPKGPRARKILCKTAFGDNWEEITSNWNAESEFAGLLDVCAGLPLALGIAGSGVNEEYEETKDEQYRKDASLAVKNYWDGLKKGSLNNLRRSNIDVIETRLSIWLKRV